MRQVLPNSEKGDGKPLQGRAFLPLQNIEGEPAVFPQVFRIHGQFRNHVPLLVAQP